MWCAGVRERQRHASNLARPSRKAAAPPCDGCRTYGAAERRVREPADRRRRGGRARARRRTRGRRRSRPASAAGSSAGAPGRCGCVGTRFQSSTASASPSSASTRWTIVAVASAGPGAAELPLRGQRDAADARAAVAGRLGDEQERRVAGAPRGRREPLAAERGPLAVAVEVVGRADAGTREPLDERGRPHRAHSDRRRPGRDRGRAAGSPSSSAPRGGRSSSRTTTSTSARETAAIVGGAIAAAAARGVAVRFVYNVDHRNPIPVPPPPEPDGS